MRAARLFALLLLALGLAGLSGSSIPFGSSIDSLLEPAAREQHLELFGHAKSIRSDEWSVEAPMQRAQQLTAPSFPLVNLDQGLGQIQRNPYTVPVADWGVAFRPLTWPLFAGNRWSLGVRWFLRSCLLVLGLAGWIGAVTRRRSGPAPASTSESTVLFLSIVAIVFSSAFSWWLSTALPEVVGYTGLALGALLRAFEEDRRLPRVAWLAAAAWLTTCAFFTFYPPIWAPTLWLLCGVVFDDQLRRAKRIPVALLRSIPIVAVMAGCVVLAILYYAPYLAIVTETLYPGRRAALGGQMPLGRLLDLAWPSLQIVAWRGDYIGPFEGMNVCEASAAEVMPLLVLLPVAALNGRIRDAVGRAFSSMPGTLLAWGVIAVWLILPVSGLFGTVTLLRWSPWNRVWFTFGLATALLLVAILAEVARNDPFQDPPPRRSELVAAVLVLAGSLLAAQTWFVARPLTWPTSARHWIPIGLFVALLLAGLAVRRSRVAAVLLAASWAVPLLAANAGVNPLVRSRDLFREGVGHRVVGDALRETPGRILHYWTHFGGYLSGFGWPLLAGVEVGPDLGLFRYMAAETPGLTEEIYNRYAHVLVVMPPAPTRLRSMDLFEVPFSPCSQRLATLAVNHLLTGNDAQLPPACAADWQRRPAGDLLLWTRKQPVQPFGVARRSDPTSALDFDFTAVVPRLEGKPRRDGFDLTIPAGLPGPVAFAVNRSLIDRVHCSGGRASALDAHLVFTAKGGEAVRCRVRYLATRGALRRLLHQGPATIFTND